VSAQATPGSVCSAAWSYHGAVWNSHGCWVLASDITAQAGASLPVVSALADVPGQSNGEWFVAYDGPAGSSGDPLSMLKPGEAVTFVTAGGTGHITTVVSGYGADAQVIDNITYVDGSGRIVNSAKDGSDQDVVIAPNHSARQELAGVDPSSIVIYELDTPVVSFAAPSIHLAGGESQKLSSLFSASDPQNKSIAAYQVYDSSAQDRFVVGGVATAANSAGTALTIAASSIGSALLQAGTGMQTTMSATMEVRAFNGTIGATGNPSRSMSRRRWFPTRPETSRRICRPWRPWPPAGGSRPSI
jgi:hypothetical protein